jgi:lipopolysaccharide biosynthesis glycosyltransferase
MKKLIVLVSDQNYLTHTKYLFSNIINDTNYDGDLCLITNIEVETSEFEEKNIFVKKYEKIDPYFQKLNLFDTYFKNWDKVLYLDCDTMVIKKDLNKLFDLDGDMYCEPEPWVIREYFNPDNNVDLFRNLQNEYNLEKVGFNSGSLLYNTSVIDEDTKNDLFSIKEKYQQINEHTRKEGGDQPILNLKFIDLWKEFPNNEISFWIIEQSGYSRRIINNIDHFYTKRPNPDGTIIYHFVSPFAPWVNHNVSPYGVTYNEVYHNNISKFNNS